MLDTGDDLRLLVDFVRRLRRVALHPLALEGHDRINDGGVPLPSPRLCVLMHYLGRAQVNPRGQATIRCPLPDEVEFESLATRVRVFTLSGYRLYWRKALDALDRVTGQEDRALRVSSAQLREEWTKATERNTPNERAYRVGYQVGHDGDGEHGHFTDIDMAYAWLYQDAAKADEVSTGYFDINERYRAAVGVFSNIAVVAVETLHYINALAELGVLALPVGTFSDPVVVTDREYVQQVYWLETEVGADLSVLDPQVPKDLRPGLELAKRLMADPDVEQGDGGQQ